MDIYIEGSEENFMDIIDLLENNLELIYKAHPEYYRVYFGIEHEKNSGRITFLLEGKMRRRGIPVIVHILLHKNIEKFYNILHSYILLCKAQVDFNNAENEKEE